MSNNILQDVRSSVFSPNTHHVRPSVRKKCCSAGLYPNRYADPSFRFFISYDVKSVRGWR